MFRFTIRDVLWAILAVGLALGWLVDSRRKTAEIMDGRNAYWIQRQSIDVEAKVIGYEVKGRDDWSVELVRRPTR